MKNNKSPGLDGYTVEFLKFFWNDIGHFVLRSVNEGYNSGELSVSFRRGVITCIPKQDKCKFLLKNWRPISLLSVLYKLASLCIAERMKKVLPMGIHGDQKGFIKDRFIGENLRIIYDIMFESKARNIPGIILLIDFEKAFDSVSWQFLRKCLHFFNFGESMIRWVSVLYKNTESCIIQNGHLGDSFKLGRGCRQGDPLSPYLFLLAAEVMGIMIRSNTKIKGIEIDNTVYKISQYAMTLSCFWMAVMPL